MSQKRVYTFGNGKAEGNAKMREELGGKGANLAEMNLIGVPVPPGFTDCPLHAMDRRGGASPTPSHGLAWPSSQKAREFRLNQPLPNEASSRVTHV